MKILEALEAGASNRVFSDHRMLSILMWVAEFRVSSLSVLAELGGLAPTRKSSKTSTVFSKMLRLGLLIEGKNLLVGREAVYIVGPNAEAFLIAYGMRPRLHYSASIMSDNKTILHDLSAQKAALKRLKMNREGIAEIRSEFQLMLDEQQRGAIRPDILMVSTEGKCVGYEYEMTLKSKGRIYMTFQAHLHAIKTGQYVGVYYLFPTEALKDKYVSMWEPALWPVFDKDREKGHYRALDLTFDPGPNKSKIKFVVENYYQKHVRLNTVGS